ncbi:MAG: hypothetical protein ACRDID_09210, partial [Ktedonobacterales bacterium]
TTRLADARLGAARVIWGATLALYALVNLSASARIARRSGRAGWRLLPRLPLVFVTMHVAWGLGFWRGVFLGGTPAPRDVAPDALETPLETQTQGGH